MKKATSFATVAFVHYRVFALLGVLCLLLCSSGFSQVGIGTNPHPSAILDLSNRGRGFLLPRVSSGQRDSIANPAIGLVIFNTTTRTLNTYTALGWMEMQGTLIGRISTLNDQPAQHQGNLYAQTAASGVSTVINYTGGNGGTYHDMAIASSGVQGLTARLSAGSFARGNGTLSFQITGTPLGMGTAHFAINIGGRSTTFSRTVTTLAVYPAGTVHCLPGGAAIVDVTNPVTGRTWMDRNLGASNVARWATDPTSFGDLYQWGRLSDGHQCRDKNIVRSEWSTSDAPSHGFFISINGGMQVLPGWNNTLDWRVPQNDNLWQGLNGINNPCPSGYRLPTESEWQAEQNSWTSNDTAGAFASPLKLPAAGFRTANFATVQNNVFSYWVSTTNGYGVGASGGIRSSGASVRCIKDDGPQPAGSISSLVCLPGAVGGGVAAFQPAGDIFQLFNYTGGNGGVHNGQSVASTGVTGLTATLSPGSFTTGNGALVYRISGTPNGAGIARFNLSIGGQSCTFDYIVAGNPAVIAGALDCIGAERLGELYSGAAAANNVRSIIRYTGGNGGTYATQTIASAGVTGLTAVLPGGRLASGDSTLSFVISGTPSSSGIAVFSISVGGKSCTFSREVGPPLATLNSLNCTGATHTGLLVAGAAAMNVSSIISYTAANGGSIPAVSFASTGVTGLTATTVPGAVNQSNGTIQIQITGTPSAAGLARFAISIGGQTCEFSRTVLASGTIAGINCATGVNKGVLSSGVAASGVSFSVGYSGGDGGGLIGQTVASTGVPGLTATLLPGILAMGDGIFTYHISGTATASGTASFALSVAGRNCSFSVPVAPAPVYAPGTVHCLPGGTPVVDVTNPATGRTWMDRNLGSEPKPEFGSGFMTPGDLFQWGRAADGHQCRESDITSTLSSANVPGHGKFITNDLDWRNPENPNLWQGVNGINNPCPSGYRIPTAAEWEAEQASWPDRDVFGALTSVLKVYFNGGYREGADGMLRMDKTAYWSSTANNAVTRVALVSPVFGVTNDFRGHGHLVRCIKDNGTTTLNPITSIGCYLASPSFPQPSLFKDSLVDGASISIPYTGGNGSAYSGQVVQSTGITGLTATLAPGNFAIGNGTLTYNITGRASVEGSALFAINIGGLQCTRVVSIVKGPGTVAGLDSAGTTHSGTLVRGTAAVGAGFSIPYTGGNGGTFAAQSIESTGVLGLTASIEAGTFNVGSGSLNFSVSGTPATVGTARFTVNIGGRSCVVIRTVAPPPGTLTGLNCVAVDSTGTLLRGVAATAVSATIGYSGANAGTYASQSIPSTGVAGLTASLQGGVFADGSGTLTFSITGTPSSAGVASFAVSIGGQSCVLRRTVALPPGTVSSLNCAGSIANGVLVAGLPATGVSQTINYGGGNGGSFAGQTVVSSGVTGLTATLLPGVFAIGSDALSLAITGTPSAVGTANFTFTLAGQTCSFSRSVAPPPGTLTGLNCAATDSTGTLQRGVAATAVTSTISYSGATAGTYSSQSIPSTGVAGLTASLQAGVFTAGSGTLTLTITGTPTSAGVASFALSIGGQSCVLRRTVALPPGTVSSLNCAASRANGVLVAGLPASGVSQTISYSGGNGGSFPGQTVVSTGVSGLTATLLPGIFATGSDTLNAAITGTPNSVGTATFTFTLGGQTCSFSRSVAPQVGSVVALACNGPDTTGVLERGIAASGVSSTIQYIGGDGGMYPAQSIASTGVPGLTATLAAGQLQVGAGSLVFTISGTPTSEGTASFAIDIGGQTCVIRRSVRVRPGVVSSLSCASPINRGALFAGIPAESVAVLINYDGGNGGTYPALSIPSADVTGLTATLAAGNFSPSSDTLRFAIAGTALATGTARFSFNLGGQACSFGVLVRPQVGTIGALNCTGIDSTGLIVHDAPASGASTTLRYTGGNGGAYAAQTIASTGVTGLTASIPAGWFEVGAGNLVFTITGTPTSDGVASFAINIGGRTCTMMRSVRPRPAVVDSFHCSTPTSTGSLFATIPANGATVAIRYAGGNGGAYNAYAIPSVGVSGLTATLQAGRLVSGSDSLRFVISGTPAAAGTASFTFSLGGRSCTFVRVVGPPISLVSSLNCAGATVRGGFEQSIPVNGASFSVPFSGGQGSYLEQVIPSAGVSGLTARLPAGNLNAGSGLLNFTITGTPVSSGNASFTIGIGGQTCTVVIPVAPEPVYPAGTVHCAAGPAVLRQLTSPGTGRIWMDRNLGASTTSTNPENPAAWGDLYQWGRGADGHQCRNSAVRNTLSSVDQPGHGDFILPNPALRSDWRNPKNDNLWQGVNGVNNPCPTGYRLPTLAEWQSEGAAVNHNFVYTTSLNLTHAGFRSFDKNTFAVFETTHGFYWTSTLSTQTPGFSVAFYFNTGWRQGTVFQQPRGYGFAVRCIRN